MILQLGKITSQVISRKNKYISGNGLSINPYINPKRNLWNDMWRPKQVQHIGLFNCFHITLSLNSDYRLFEGIFYWITFLISTPYASVVTVTSKAFLCKKFLLKTIDCCLPIKFLSLQKSLPYITENRLFLNPFG